MTKQWEQRWSFDFSDDAALDAEIAQAKPKRLTSLKQPFPEHSI